MRDLDDIALTEEIHGEAIMPRDVEGELSAQQAVADTPDWAHITVRVSDGVHEWLVAKRRPGGWVSAGTYYPDSRVIEAHARHVFDDDALRQHDAEVQAGFADHLADHWPMAWPQAGEQWLRDQAKRTRAEAAS